MKTVSNEGKPMLKRSKKKKKLYGLRKYWPHLTQAQAEKERAKLAKKQDNRCAICQKHESEFKRKLSVDHSHKSKAVRGLLCYRCNRYLVGRNDLESATKLFNYLQVERNK